MGGKAAAGFFAFGHEALTEADWSVALAAGEGGGPTAEHAAQRWGEAPRSRPGGDHGGSPVASRRRGWRYNGEDGRVAQLDRAPAF
jgi:hypothetical protein